MHSKKLESRVRKALHQHEMLDEADKVAVALSGGKDSLTLLSILHKIKGRGFPDFKLFALHVSGAFSCGAGVTVDHLRRFCEGLDVEFVAKEATQTLENLECYSCSRQRRKLLFDAAKERGIETIAFGHHRDDLAQTVLLNLFSKGEFEGMLPKLKMYRYGVTIIRPLIFVSEQEIIQYAKSQSFLRAVCKCPVGQQSMRKKVDDLLSDIADLFPDARSNIAQAGLRFGSQKAAENPQDSDAANR